MYNKEKASTNILSPVIKHLLTNVSVLLILDSLVIGFLASEQQAMGIKPFTTDIFKGFLAIFLLDMGIICEKKLDDFFKSSWFAKVFALFVPLFNGCIVAYLSQIVVNDIGNRFIFSVLAASASYIAVPAAMKIVAPKANPGLFLPIALALTLPFNITLGFPIYLAFIL